MSDQPICELYFKVVELAGSRGLAPLNAQAQPVRVDFGQQWAARINASGEAIDGIPPYEIAFERDGMLCGLLGPYEGAMFGSLGSPRLEDEAIAAIDTELAMEVAQP